MIKRQATISAADEKKKIQSEMAKIQKRENSVEKKESELKNEQSAIKQMKENTERLIDEKAKELNEIFRIKWCGLMYLVTAYGFLATFFTIFKSERCLNDFKAIWHGIVVFSKVIFEIILTLSVKAASISSKINQPMVSGIVKGLILTLIMVLFMGAIIISVIFVFKIIAECYLKHCGDWITAIILLGSFAVVVWFAENIPLNIVILFMIMNTVYLIIRWYIDGYKENHQYGYR